MLDHIEPYRLPIGISVAATILMSTACAGRIEPPARYGHAYSGKLEVHYLDASAADRICKAHLTQWGRVSGCMLSRDKTTCTIVVSSRNPDPAYVIRHETGHCNGWPAEHPL